MPGPVPKRSDQRRRRNKEGGEIDALTRMSHALIPAADENWHPVAHQWYESLKDSSISQYYDASDWATAYYVAEAMHRNLAGGRFSGQLFAAIMSAMTDLLTTEGARRRARIELERDQGEAEQKGLASVSELRKRATGGR